MQSKKEITTKKLEIDEIKNMLHGCEILSVNYEGCVSIEAGQVIQEGKQIDLLNTHKKVIAIWNEYLEQEGIRFMRGV